MCGNLSLGTILPLETLENIFVFTDPTTIIAAERVCRSWYASARSEQLWRVLILSIHALILQPV